VSKKGVTNDFLAEKDPFFFFFFSVWFLREVKEIKEEGGGRRYIIRKRLGSTRE
jgi:hypothetical protein